MKHLQTESTNPLSGGLALVTVARNDEFALESLAQFGLTVSAPQYCTKDFVTAYGSPQNIRAFVAWCE